MLLCDKPAFPVNLELSFLLLWEPSDYNKRSNNLTVY